MKSKGFIIAVVCIVVALCAFGVGLIHSAPNLLNLNYVKLKINPEIEFVVKKNKVVAYNPVNEHAKILCVNEEFMGKDIEDAVEKFLELSLRTGYLQIEKKDNSVMFTAIEGISQNLEVTLYKTISNYFKNNELLGVIMEESNNNESVLKAKEKGVILDTDILINSYINLNPNVNYDSLKLKSRGGLIKEIKKEIDKLNVSPTNYTQEQLKQKNILINENKIEYGKHLEKITPQSQSEFLMEFTKNQKEIKKQLKQDYMGAYEIWKTNHNNYIR